MNKLIRLVILSTGLGMGISACSDNTPTQINSPSIAQTAVEKSGSHHQGESLHNEKCTSCHKDQVYTREDRMVKTMSALENQVNNCMTGAAKAEWTQAQTTSVIEFLNDRYYKF